VLYLIDIYCYTDVKCKLCQTVRLMIIANQLSIIQSKHTCYMARYITVIWNIKT